MHGNIRRQAPKQHSSDRYDDKDNLKRFVLRLIHLFLQVGKLNTETINETVKNCIKRQSKHDGHG
jgi:hypothetical protein